MQNLLVSLFYTTEASITQGVAVIAQARRVIGLLDGESVLPASPEQ